MKKKTGLSTLKIRVPRKRSFVKPSAPRPQKKEDGIEYTGFVHGKDASRPEEIEAMVLDKHNKNYEFRYRVPVAGLPGARGDYKELDFLISDDRTKLVQVANTAFIHHSPKQLEEDRQSDALILQFFKEYGALEIIWIDDFYLQDPEMAELRNMELGII